jgi:hypothetical protein
MNAQSATSVQFREKLPEVFGTPVVDKEAGPQSSLSRQPRNVEGHDWSGPADAAS